MDPEKINVVIKPDRNPNNPPYAETTDGKYRMYLEEKDREPFLALAKKWGGWIILRGITTVVLVVCFISELFSLFSGRMNSQFYVLTVVVFACIAVGFISGRMAFSVQQKIEVIAKKYSKLLAEKAAQNMYEKMTLQQEEVIPEPVKEEPSPAETVVEEPEPEEEEHDWISEFSDGVKNWVPRE